MSLGLQIFQDAPHLALRLRQTHSLLLVLEELVQQLAYVLLLRLNLPQKLALGSVHHRQRTQEVTLRLRPGTGGRRKPILTALLAENVRAMLDVAQRGLGHVAHQTFESVETAEEMRGVFFALAVLGLEVLRLRQELVLLESQLLSPGPGFLGESV